MKLLLVEDNEGDAELVRLFCRELHGPVELVHRTDCASALEALVECDFDALLLDLSLPDSTGLETVTRLRERAPRLPMIVLTGLQDDRTALEALGRGAQDYLLKDDLGPRLLSRSLRYAVERQRGQDELWRQRQNMEAERGHARLLESIGRLAAGIAHEVNTPTQFVGDNARFLAESVGSLMELLELLLAREAAGPDRAGWDDVRRKVEDADLDFLRAEIPVALAQLQEGIDRIVTIVSAMKDFSRSSRGRKEPVDLNRAIEATVTVCRSRWKDVAELELHLDPDLPLVPCRVDGINQVVLNVVVNAADAVEAAAARRGGARGRIEISTACLDDAVEIRVHDDGDGVSEAARERLFDPFYTTKPPGRGTGQGLAISYDIVVDKHGGTIACESEPGCGSTFVVRLPLDPAGPDARE